MESSKLVKELQEKNAYEKSDTFFTFNPFISYKELQE